MQPRESVAPNVQHVSRRNCHTLREVISIGDRLSHWQMGGDGADDCYSRAPMRGAFQFVEPPRHPAPSDAGVKSDLAASLIFGGGDGVPASSNRMLTQLQAQEFLRPQLGMALIWQPLPWSGWSSCSEVIPMMTEIFLSHKRVNIENVREHVHVSKHMSQHSRNFQTRLDANKKAETTHALLLC